MRNLEFRWLVMVSIQLKPFSSGKGPQNLRPLIGSSHQGQPVDEVAPQACASGTYSAGTPGRMECIHSPNLYTCSAKIGQADQIIRLCKPKMS
jgi:hypothetical protein